MKVFRFTSWGEEKNLLLCSQNLINVKETRKEELRFSILPAGGRLYSALIQRFIFDKSIQTIHICSLGLRQFTLVLGLN